MTLSSLPDWVLRQLTPGETSALQALPDRASTGKPMIRLIDVSDQGLGDWSVLSVQLRKGDTRRDQFHGWHKHATGLYIEFFDDHIRESGCDGNCPRNWAEVVNGKPTSQTVTRLRKRRKQQRSKQ